MTNPERQLQIDKKKWLESEKRGYDMSGKMKICSVCEHQNKACEECTIDYLETFTTSACAKAYNKFYKLSRAKKLKKWKN